MSLCNALEHLKLARRERAHRRALCAAGIQPLEIEPGAELLEHESRRGKLELARFFITKRRAGFGDEHAHPRGLIRRFEMFPALERLPQVTQRSPCVATAQAQCPARLRRLRLDDFRFECGAQRLEFLASALRFLKIADAQHDLEVSWQDSAAHSTIGG